MADEFQVHGVQAMQAELRKLARLSHDEAAEALVDGSEFLLGEARKGVPWQDGDLERSGTASQDRDELQAAVSFNTPYAVRQHEELSYQHDDGRRAKYLELAMVESRPKIAQIVLRRLQMLWGG